MDKSTEQAFDKIERVADMAMIERNAAIARAERAEAALIGRIELCTELSKEIQRLRQRAERAEAALAAVPWQAMLNIAASDAANDPDEAALLSFLNRYAPWVPPSDNDLSPDDPAA